MTNTNRKKENLVTGYSSGRRSFRTNRHTNEIAFVLRVRRDRVAFGIEASVGRKAFVVRRAFDYELHNRRVARMRLKITFVQLRAGGERAVRVDRHRHLLFVESRSAGGHVFGGAIHRSRK
jgi:hypothetical protein